MRLSKAQEAAINGMTSAELFELAARIEAQTEHRGLFVRLAAATFAGRMRTLGRQQALQEAPHDR